MTVGEAPMMTPKTAMKFIEENKDQKLNMMFHFQHMEADCLFYSWIRAPFSLRKLRTFITTGRQSSTVRHGIHSISRTTISRGS